MAINKAKARKIKRRLAYIYFPVLFAVLGIFVVRLVFVTVVPTYKDYRKMAFGSAPSFTKQLDKKSFVAFEGRQSKTFNNIGVTIPDVGQQYAEIVCEELDIEAPVFWGDSKLALKSGVGTYTASALPGYPATILMTAHNTTYFAGLRDCKEGTVLQITTTYGKFEYVVRQIKVLDKDAAGAVDFSKKTEQLVLYTCYPFKPMSAVSNQRMFVYCDKLSGPSVKNWEVDL